MSKYRVLCKYWGADRRTHWDTVSAKSPEDAIKKAKAQEKATHDKYNKGKRFKSRATSWKAIKA